MYHACFCCRCVRTFYVYVYIIGFLLPFTSKNKCDNAGHIKRKIPQAEENQCKRAEEMISV